MITRPFTKRYISLLFLLISSSAVFSQNRWRLQLEAGIPYTGSSLITSKLTASSQSNLGLIGGNLALSYTIEDKRKFTTNFHSVQLKAEYLGSFLFPLAFAKLNGDVDPWDTWINYAANELEVFGVQYLFNSSDKKSGYGIDLRFNYYFPDDNTFPQKLVIGFVRNRNGKLKKNLGYTFHSELYRSIITPGSPVGGPVRINLAGINTETSLTLGQSQKHDIYCKLRYMRVLKLYSFLTFTPNYLYRIELGYRHSIAW